MPATGSREELCPELGINFLVTNWNTYVQDVKRAEGNETKERWLGRQESRYAAALRHRSLLRILHCESSHIFNSEVIGL